MVKCILKDWLPKYPRLAGLPTRRENWVSRAVHTTWNGGLRFQPETGVLQDPQLVSQEEKDRGYQEYNHDVVGSDEEANLSKMIMGRKAKGALHRWDFETREEWEKYNEQKEAMPKAAFHFGVGMQDGRKTKKQKRDQKRDQKLNNELNKINIIITGKKM
ncbi:hypothetical protein Bca52824_035309 [Brassica carinata]|uniref:Protein RED C-terminal domain-containing protein n=1 Tax=Brassica carinata TaxID=52824 RepID=A0A8X7S2W7_BRACI|nr:hypothetical protein Bca52824_035309 [Brassica carinata]